MSNRERYYKQYIADKRKEMNALRKQAREMELLVRHYLEEAHKLDIEIQSIEHISANQYKNGYKKN